jgi:chitinase
MKRIFIVIMSFVLIQSVTCKNKITGPGIENETKKVNSTFTVVGYLPDYRVATIDINIGKYVDDLIFFSIEPTPSGELETDRFTSDVKTRLGLIKALNNTRLLVAIGGWGRSAGFAAMATNMGARQIFIQNITKFCQDNGFKGVDFDWEFPSNISEEIAYWNLLSEVKKAFIPHNLIVTVALNVHQKLNPSAFAAIDHLHIMSYDQGTRHSTFENGTTAVDIFIKQNIAPKKLFFGVPFYGRNMSDTNIAMTYKSIVQNYHPGPEVDEVSNIYFNGINTIKRKTRYALDTELGGIMIWELGQDTKDETSLLKAINEEISQGK